MNVYKHSINIKELLDIFELLNIESGDNILIETENFNFLGEKFRLDSRNMSIKMIEHLKGRATKGSLVCDTSPHYNFLYKYVIRDYTFDVLKSRSGQGIFSEVFRRDNDSNRSDNPILNLSIIGSDESLIANSLDYADPYKIYEKLYETKGKILFINKKYSNSIFYLDSLVENEKQFLFPKPFVVSCRKGNQKYKYQTLLRTPPYIESSRRYNGELLQRCQSYQVYKIKNCEIGFVEYREFIDKAKEMYEEGHCMYDFAYEERKNIY
jgi:aminoglycoside N3'-acetyltransferase